MEGGQPSYIYIIETIVQEGCDKIEAPAGTGAGRNDDDDDDDRRFLRCA